MHRAKRRPGWVAAVWLAGAATLQAHLPTVTLTSTYLNFVAAPGAVASAQTVRLGTNEHPYQWTAAVNTAQGGAWLSVTPDRGSLNGNFESSSLIIRVASANLAAGVYYGTITINAPGADNSPRVIEVALAVTTSGQAAPGFAITPLSLDLEGVRGGGRNPTQSIQVRNAGGGALNWTAMASTDGGGPWLAVNPGSGADAEVVVATVAAGSLNVGSYTGRITFAAAGAANSPRTIPVTLRVRDPLPPTLVLTPLTVSFAAVVGDHIPSSQTLVITNGGEGTLNWRASATTFDGGPWLSATPGSGSGLGVVTLSADTAGLPVGTYTGRVTVTSDGAMNSPIQVSVSLAVRKPQPVFSRAGVVNAATFLPTPVAPGEIVSIFGSRLGPVEGVAFTLEAGSRRLPETLAGVHITFDGVSAPLFYVSEQQINLQVPFEVAGKTSTRMVVNVEGQEPAEMSIEVSEAAPGLFTFGGLQAAALNQDFAVNGPDHPAAVGSVVQLFLTGQGLLVTSVRTGELAPATPPFPEPSLPVAVTIHGLNARVLFAGLAPGFAGLTQLNVEVPRGTLPTSQARVAVAFGVYQALRTATIAVR